MTRVAIEAHELDALAVYAARYAIGRASYAPDEVCAILAPHVDALSAQTRAVIARDIDEAAARDRLGPHAARWRALREALLRDPAAREALAGMTRATTNDPARDGDELAGRDVPALVAEVRRLRAAGGRGHALTPRPLESQRPARKVRPRSIVD